MGWLSGPPKKAPVKGKGAPSKSGKCPTCKKSLLSCAGHYADRGTAEKARVQVTDSRGKTRTVTKNTGNTVRAGITWCGTCSCRVMNGTCSNVTCSTRSAR